ARHRLAHLLLHALGADAEVPDAWTVALRAYGRRIRAASAAVAHERSVEVIGERDLAGRALGDVPAVAAQHDRREAAAVEIEDGLVALRDGALEREAQRPRERAAIARFQLEPEIDHRRRRQREIAHALR